MELTSQMKSYKSPLHIRKQVCLLEKENESDFESTSEILGGVPSQMTKVFGIFNISFSNHGFDVLWKLK